MRFLFTLATFVGSLALFLIEPMVAKALLPSFGGSSLVWNVSLLFFQAALLGGYAYANALCHRGQLKAQSGVHLTVLGVALVLTALLLIPARLWQIHPSPEASPVWQLLLTLTLTTAAPFVVLAAGTPLIQRWFAHSDDAQAHDPYFLYAASNLGSFCGLIAYPVLVEPRLTLIQQRELVFVLFAVYGLLLLRAAFTVKGFIVQAEQVVPPEPVARLDKAKWAALSAAPSALLLAVTTDLTKNIAPIPLLWVAPLGLYLLTFVIVFSGRTKAGEIPPWFRVTLALALAVAATWTIKSFLSSSLAWAIAIGLYLLAGVILVSDRTKRLDQLAVSPIWLRITLALALACGATLVIGTNLVIQLGVGLSLICFFFATLACHLQLARLRPHASQLTTYYLWVSIGGVMGGLFCAILAPLLFTGLYELPIAYAATVALIAVVQPRRGFSFLDVVMPIASWVGLFFLFGYGNTNGFSPVQSAQWVGAIFLVSCLWPHRLALAYVGFIVIFGFTEKLPNAKVLYAARNFYGYEKVISEANGAYHRLINGTILHGAQFTDPVKSRQPTTYYSKDGPLGMALLPLIAHRPLASLGAVGLGSGTEAAYGRPGMRIDFYELNPEIRHIATTRSLFTYVTDSPAKVQIILGDARLSLVDAPDGSYDAIILDAFSSDSIPVHLLTQQAFELYQRKLKPDGIVLVHTSNRYLMLSEVVAATGASAGFTADWADDQPAQDSLEHSATTWVCLAGSRQRLKEIEGGKSLWRSFSSTDAKPWTDDYSDVFDALRIRHLN